jgi:putative transposase
LPVSVTERRAFIEPSHGRLSVSRQCELAGLARSTYYHAGAGETAENLALMRQIDEVYLEHPTFGSRMMTQWLKRAGQNVNRKRIQRLMRRMGLEAIYPRPRTSVPGTGHRIYPYLLRHRVVARPDEVWCADITYVPLSRGFMYLVAIMDWHSRYVLAWRLCNTMEAEFCIEALQEALGRGRPEIFNTDQGAQFTSRAFTGVLEQAGIQVSMDGRGRALDNVFVERLWRTVKYEHVYVRGYETAPELAAGLAWFFDFYDHSRLHSALDYRTPWEVYSAGGRRATAARRKLRR